MQFENADIIKAFYLVVLFNKVYCLIHKRFSQNWLFPFFFSIHRGVGMGVDKPLPIIYFPVTVFSACWNLQGGSSKMKLKNFTISNFLGIEKLSIKIWISYRGVLLQCSLKLFA